MHVNASESLEHVTDRAFNDRRYFVDCSKLEKLGWAQKVTWKEGLRETIQWYLNFGHEYWDDVEPALEAHSSVSLDKLLRWHRNLIEDEKNKASSPSI